MNEHNRVTVMRVEEDLLKNLFYNMNSSADIQHKNQNIQEIFRYIPFCRVFALIILIQKNLSLINK
jgi:hypothetical protein